MEAFKQRAKRVTAAAVSAKNIHHEEENYLRVTYTYAVNGKTYNHKRDFSEDSDYPKEHELFYDESKPSAAYWAVEHAYSKCGDAFVGCLASIFLFVAYWAGFGVVKNLCERYLL